MSSSPPELSNKGFRSAVWLICLATALRSVADRSWTFILPVFLAEADPSSLAPTAVLSAVQSLSITVFSPALAKLAFDDTDRKSAFRRLMVVENVAVFLGGLTMLSIPQGSGLLYHAGFWIGAMFMGVDAVTSSILSVSVEKDWVTTVTAGDLRRLNEANAWVARVDLGSSVVSYLVLGQLVSSASPNTMLLMLGVWHLVAATVLYAVVGRLCKIAPGLRRVEPSGAADMGGGYDDRDQSASTGGGTGGFARGLRAFRRLPTTVRMVMVAYILLYLTVLSPSGLLTAWLTSQKVPIATIATFRSVSQLVGCGATVLVPSVIGAVGALRGGLVALLMQSTCVLAAVWAVTLGSGGGGGPEVLMVAVAASRLGLWAFDLSERQLVQHQTAPGGTVHEHDRALLFNWEKSLCDGTYLVILALSLVCSAPGQFWILVLASAAAVLSATGLVAFANVSSTSREKSSRNFPV